MQDIFLIYAIIFGLCFGSFLNVLIVRLPMNKSVIAPASACLFCGNKLRFYHNIPIFSYIFLRGKCGFCGARISILYPIIESISAILGGLIYLKFGLNGGFVLISILLLLALAVIDLKFKEVSDSLNFSAFLFGILGGIFLYKDLMLTFGSAFGMAGLFCLLRFAFQSFAKKEALGEGDIIIAGTMGAILGYQLCLIAIFIASLFALVVLLIIRKKNYALPFIPFLLCGTLCVLFFNEFFNALLREYILKL